jgi:group I intron endonuclease
MSGIYIIISNSKTNRFYIGSAINLKARKRHHFNALKRGDHCNKKLQRHFNKYGVKDLKFYTILECSEQDLLKVEQYFLDFYNPYFNICKVAGSQLGLKRSKETVAKLKRKIVSNDTKIKMSIIMKGNKNAVGCKRTEKQKEHLRQLHLGKNNIMYGKHLSDETKTKMKNTVLNKKINNHN